MSDDRDHGELGSNVVLFARILRGAGLPVGPGKAILAIKALSVIDITNRDDVFWTLHAVYVERRSQFEVFRIAFDHFWTTQLDDTVDFSILDDDQEDGHSSTGSPMPRRLAESLVSAGLGEVREAKEQEFEIDSSETWSSVEQLRTKDFESMSSEELAITRDALRNMKLPIPEIPARRFRPHASGRRIDMRSTLRKSVRSAGGIELSKKKRIRRHPPLVVLCDISGSMEAYARMLLHFLHAVTNDKDRIHTFLFGTRLTNVTRHLTHNDPDIALSRVGQAVFDWSGGTRIGETLSQFNRVWSRQVLAQGAVVLFISDGLDRDGGEGVSKEMDRLKKSCRRLIWLNPLLRYDGFEPRSAGVKAMLPHVDEFRPVHNLDSLTKLTDALATMGSEGRWGPPQSEVLHG